MTDFQTPMPQAQPAMDFGALINTPAADEQPAIPAPPPPPVLGTDDGRMTAAGLHIQRALKAQVSNAKPKPFHGERRQGVGMGLVTPGNVNLHNRKVAHNTDGSISTVRSITVTGDRGQAVLLPTVIDGKVVSNDEAIKHYQKTGEHLGVFTDEAAADRYAESLHKVQAKEYDKTTAIATAPDSLAMAGVMGHADPITQAKVAAAPEVYKQNLSDYPPEGVQGAANLDFAKVHHLISESLVPSTSDSGKRLKRLWSLYQSDPHKLSAADTQDLNGLIRAVGDATNSVSDPKLKFQGGKITSVEFTDMGAVPFVEFDDTAKSLAGVSPEAPQSPSPGRKGVYVLPDTRLAVFATQSPEDALQLRSMYPALERGGVSQYMAGRPRTVMDLEQSRASLASHMTGHVVHTWANSAWKDGHPVTKNQHTMMVNISDGPIPHQLVSMGQIVDPGMPALVEGPSKPDEPDEHDPYKPGQDEHVPGRAARRQRQIAVVVNPADIVKNAKSLAALGIEVAAVYTSQPVPGFTKVREHVVQDGANSSIIRSADPENQSSHGFHAWVPAAEAKGLPTRNPGNHKVNQVAQMRQIGPDAWTVDGAVLVRIPASGTPHPNPGRVKNNGKLPTFVGVRFGAVPTVVPTWGEKPPQGFDVIAKNDKGQLTVNVNPGEDLTNGAKFLDVLGSMGNNTSRHRLIANGETIRSKYTG